MTPVTLQISLPEQLRLSPEELYQITRRRPLRLQIEWLKANHWEYTLDADKGILVGKLYAHVRLAGLQPAALISSPAGAGGFNLDATR
jgi:hypothetical protein